MLRRETEYGDIQEVTVQILHFFCKSKANLKNKIYV